MMLGRSGTSYELCGQQLFPIGTVYDPFVCRGLDALIYDLYNRAKMIVVGTPSGITLSPEGGAHQSHHHAVDRHRASEPALLRALLRRARSSGSLLEALRQIADRQHGKSTLPAPDHQDRRSVA